MSTTTNGSRDRFDPVFASYLSTLPQIRGKSDSQTRAPDVFGEAWADLALVPSASRLILVTGSKGKGTVARLVAWNLQHRGYRVGLVVTPEELNHLDRMRINNEAISPDEFDINLNFVSLQFLNLGFLA